MFKSKYPGRFCGTNSPGSRLCQYLILPRNNDKSRTDKWNSDQKFTTWIRTRHLHVNLMIFTHTLTHTRTHTHTKQTIKNVQGILWIYQITFVGADFFYDFFNYSFINISFVVLDHLRRRCSEINPANKICLCLNKNISNLPVNLQDGYSILWNNIGNLRGVASKLSGNTSKNPGAQ